MQRKSQVFTTLFLILLSPCFSGCSSSSPVATPASPPYQGATLTIACPTEEIATLVSQYGQGWASRNGVTVTTRRYDPARGPETVADASLWVVPPAEMPRWADAGQLAPLPDRLTSKDDSYRWAMLFPLYTGQLLVWDAKPTALPLLGDAPLCLYRKDLFENPEHQAAFKERYRHPLQPPATWQDWSEIAAYFHEHRQKGKAIPSLPPLPKEDDELDRLFFSVAAPLARRAIRQDQTARADQQNDLFSFHFDWSTGASRIAHPGFVHALTLLQQMQKFRPAQSEADSWRAFQEDRAVLCLADARRLYSLQQNDSEKQGNRAPRGKSQVHDRVGVCNVPGSRLFYDYQSDQAVPSDLGANRVPYRAATGWLGVVPRCSKEPEAAFALMEQLSGPDLGRQIAIEPRWGGGLFRSTLLDERWESFQLDNKQTLALRTAFQRLYQGTQNPAVRLRTPSQQVFREVLLREVRSALLDGKDAAQALQAVDARWRDLIKERTPARHLRDYRLSLGRLP